MQAAQAELEKKLAWGNAESLGETKTAEEFADEEAQREGPLPEDAARERELGEEARGSWAAMAHEGSGGSQDAAGVSKDCLASPSLPTCGQADVIIHLEVSLESCTDGLCRQAVFQNCG